MTSKGIFRLRAEEEGAGSQPAKHRVSVAAAACASGTVPRRALAHMVSPSSIRSLA